MTDPDAPTPDEPFDGPPAPPWVGELLAGMRQDDPAIPADVAARLDAALAAAAASVPAPPAAGGGTADQATDPTVVPLRSHRRAAASPWGHRLLLGAVAAAAVVIFGGLGTLAVLRGSSPQPTGDDGPVVAGDASTAPAEYVSSGQRYTASNLVPTTRALLSATEALDQPATVASPHTVPTGASQSPASATPPPSPSATFGATATGSPSGSPEVLALTRVATRPDPQCLSQLTGTADTATIVVDEATYEKQPAFVVVVRSVDVSTGQDRPGSVDVWVVPRPCGADSTFLKFERVAR
jgi:hypothetical protein